MYILQQWFAPPNEAVKCVINNIKSICRLAAFDLAHESVLDAATLQKIRSLTGTNELTGKMFDEIKAPIAKRSCCVVRAFWLQPHSLPRRPNKNETRSKCALTQAKQSIVHLHAGETQGRCQFGPETNIYFMGDAESRVTHEVNATQHVVSDYIGGKNSRNLRLHKEKESCDVK
jgi:hypothetical protein